MSISVICPNGHRLSAKDELAGKTLRCPKCKSAVTVPLPEELELGSELEVLEEWDPLGSGSGEQTEWDPLAGDPLGILSSAAEQSFPAMADSAQAASFLSSSPQAPRSAPRQAPPAASTAGLWAAAGSGLLVGLLFTSVVGWMLLSGRDGGQVAEAAPVTRHTPDATPEVQQHSVAEPAPQSSRESGPAGMLQETRPAAETQAPGLTFADLRPAESPLDLTPVESDERLEVFQLPGKTWAADYDGVSGSLALTNDDVGILVYDIDETAKGRPGPVAAFPTEGLPTGVCFKPMPTRRLLVIAGTKRAKVEVFDADVFEKVGEVSAPDAKFLDYLAGSPNREDAYVYYSTQRSDQDESRQYKAERLGRLDMDLMQAETLVIRSGPPGRQVDVEATAILFSEDGETLYLRDSHGGTKCVSFERGSDGKDNPVILGGQNVSATCAVGPNEQLLAAGKFLSDRYFLLHLGTAEFDIEAFLQKRPLMVGFNSNSLVFGSTNDFRSLATIPLPGACLPSKLDTHDFRMLVRSRPDLEADFVKAFVDEPRGLVVCVLLEHVVVAPLSRLNLPVERSITVARRLPDKVYVNEQVSFQLETEAEDVVFQVGDGRDASGKEMGKWALGSDGFDENLPRISQRTLTWTPSEDQVGLKYIHLRTRQGKLTREWSWRVSVEQRPSELAFYVTGVNIDVTGRVAAVWGRSASGSGNFLGVFDVEQRKLVRQAEVPQAVHSATIDASGVYASFGTQLARLNRDTLELEAQTDLGFPADLEVVAGKYLAARGRRGEFGRLTLGDMRPVRPTLHPYPYLPLGGRLENQWMWDGVVWDAEMKTPELLAFPAQFGVPPARDDRAFPGGGAMFGYQTPGRYTGPLNTDTPTYESGCTPFGYAGFLYVQYGQLNLHENIAHLNGVRPDKPVKSIMLSTDPGAADDWGYMSCSRDVTAVAYGGRLSWISMDELLPGQGSFKIARKQSTFVLGAADPTSVRYEAKDAVKYTLLLWTRRPDPSFYDEPQLKAESTDGTFNISLESVQLADDAVQAVKSARFPDSGGTTLSLDAYIDAVSPAFESLAGRKPSGVPFPVYAVVVAESSYRETDYLVHSFLVEVPVASVEGILK